MGQGRIILPNVNHRSRRRGHRGQRRYPIRSAHDTRARQSRRPIASCGIPLSSEVTLKDFSRRLKPLAKKSDGEKP